MKINDVKDPSAQMIEQYHRNDTSNNQAVEKQMTVPSAPEEKVEISTRAKDIQQVKNAIANLPDVREEKVRELKSQIDKGTYAVNSAKVAEKMVSDSLLDIFV